MEQKDVTKSQTTSIAVYLTHGAQSLPSLSLMGRGEIRGNQRVSSDTSASRGHVLPSVDGGSERGLQADPPSPLESPCA